jgi:hypothetical protein
MRKQKFRDDDCNLDLLSLGITKINNLLNKNNDYNEEHYIKSEEDSSHSRRILPCPEITWLMGNPIRFSEFILHFKKLVNRRFILTRKEIIGFTINELYLLYGINKDMILKFIGSAPIIESTYLIRDNMIREVLKRPFEFEENFISFMLILARVPFYWLDVKVPEKKWKTNHFHYLYNITIDEDELVTIISNIKPKVHDVRPIILQLRNNSLIYLRIELQFGSFLVECFNQDCPLSLCNTLYGLLKPYSQFVGRIQTVVPNQENFVIVGKEWPSKYLPPGLKQLYF